MLTSLFLYEARQRLKFPAVVFSLSLRLVSLFSSSKTSLETLFSGFFFLSWRIFLLHLNPSTRTRPALYSYTLLFSFSVHFLIFFLLLLFVLNLYSYGQMCVCVKSDATANTSTFIPASHTVYRICWYHVYHCSTLIVPTCRFTEKNLTWGDALSRQ